MDPNQTYQSTLGELCLSKLRHDLDQFPTSSLGLLPLQLRHHLLCGLPAADICKLEVSKVINGVDLGSIWQSLVEYFVNLLFNRTPASSECLEEYYGPYLQPKFLLPSAKDNFIAMISKLLFLSLDENLDPVYEYFNNGRSQLVAGLLYGFSSPETSNKCITIPTSGKSPICVPRRYANNMSESEEEESRTKLISRITSVFNQGPKMMHFCVDERINGKSLFSVDDQILLPFLSGVEEFGVHFLVYDYKESEAYCHLLRKIVSSQLNNENPQSDCRLRSLRFEGLHTNHKLTFDNLRDYSLLSYSSQHRGRDWNYPVQDSSNTYTKLKKIEFILRERDYEIAEMSKECRLDLCSDTIAAILYNQSELEEVTLMELSSVQLITAFDCYYIYTGFEKLYFSLPWIISRSSFKSLTLEACSMPVNAAQNIIRTFLCTPTTHVQSLDLSVCTLYEAQPLSLPQGCPGHPTFPETSPCVDANLKSLSLFVNNGLSYFSWLLNHPNMNLKHLELFCNPTTMDKSTMMGIPVSDESDSESSNEFEIILPTRKHQKLSIKEAPQKSGIERLCDFICSLEQPQKLDVQIITSDALSSSEKEAVERVRQLPTLSNLFIRDHHWSLCDNTFCSF